MANRPLHRIQAAIAARRFFLGRQTKFQIAKEMSISRFKVARLIDSAVEEGIVNFVISEPNDLDVELSDKLRERFSLKQALVLSGPDQRTSALSEPLGALAAQFLEEVLAAGQLLGVAWGRTLAAMAGALTSANLPKVDVIQVCGNPTGLEYTQNPVELVHGLARLSGGRPYPIYAPMWFEDPVVAEGLRTDTTVAPILKLYDQIDVLVVGIGSWNPEESCLCSAFPHSWHDQALADGVRADLCRTLIDDAGREITSPLDHLGIGISAKQIRRIPDVIGIGGGLEKGDAIAAVLRGGWINTLVTDSGVAKRLLALPPSKKSPLCDRR